MKILDADHALSLLVPFLQLLESRRLLLMRLVFEELTRLGAGKGVREAATWCWFSPILLVGRS